MLQNDINDLIIDTREILENLKSYRNISRPKVKSALEHLRSCLEYAAQDISKIITKPSKRFYFPYSDNQNDLDNSIQKNLPNLSNERPDIYTEIIRLHNFDHSNSWLKNLCDLTNGVKHNKSAEVNEDDIIDVNVNGVRFMRAINSTVVVRGSVVGGKEIDDFIIKDGDLSIIKKSKTPISFKITRDKKIKLNNGTEIDLIFFLEECIGNIDAFIKILYQKLNIEGK